MKLIRYQTPDGPRSGVVVETDEGLGVVDLQSAHAPYTTVMDIVSGGPVAIDAVAQVIAGCKPHCLLSDATLLAPIEKPGKYLAIGLNYKKHQEETSHLGLTELPRQLWFNKQTSCIAGPYEDIDPGVTEQLDYEVELGVVIGKPAKQVNAETAMEHVFGYFVANDVSARDWQFHSPTFTVGKSFDSHGPIGPWIVTADEVENPHNLNLRCLVNGEQRQSSNTSLMLHSIAEQIAYLSQAFTLESGDLLATGTPEGVGLGMEPPVFLQPGDVVRCEIEGVGVIENRVKR